MICRIFHNQRGFSLPELLIGMLLNLILMGGIAGLFLLQNRITTTEDRTIRFQQDARTALTAISRDVKLAGFNRGTGVFNSISGAASNLMIRRDMNGNNNIEADETVFFSVVNNRLRRTMGTTSQELAAHVKELQVEYRDVGGAPTANWNNVRQINISLKTGVSGSAPGFRSYTSFVMSDSFTPANLGYQP